MGSGRYDEMGSKFPATGGSNKPPLPSSSSASGLSPPSSTAGGDSLHGLKFGQKIYFEDLGHHGPHSPHEPKSSSGSLPASTPPVAAGVGQQAKTSTETVTRRKGRGVVQGAQPPRCQVEGCGVDLSNAKSYYSRHKVCGMHSKASQAIFAGVQQRFCQQCSRFHLLSEFDEGKRSCRRRLAGHNERRRKPPPGSFLSTRFGQLSSSILDSGSRTGGFLVDFTAYSRPPGMSTCSGTKPSEHSAGNHSSPTTGRFLQDTWPDNSEMFLQSSPSRSGGFSGPGTPLGDCFTGVSVSSCALSLLSNHHWGSTSRAMSIGMNNLMNADGASVSQPTAPSNVGVSHFPSSSSWGFKASEASSPGLHDVPPDLGLGQISQPLGGRYNGDLEMAHQSGHPFIEHSGAYGSSDHVHWPL